MFDINKCSRITFILENALLGVFMFFLYRYVLFVPLKEADYQASMYVLIGCAVVLITFGTVITLKRRRNNLSVAVNVLGAYSVYFVLSLWRIDAQIFGLLMAAAAFVFIFYMAPIFYKAIRSCVDGSPAPTRRQVTATLLLVRTITAMIYVSLMLSMMMILFIGETPIRVRSEVPTVNLVSDTENPLMANIEKLLPLQEEQWEKLNVQERLDLLKTVADIEAAHFGIAMVLVYADVLPENELGNYNDVAYFHSKKKQPHPDLSQVWLFSLLHPYAAGTVKSYTQI